MISTLPKQVFIHDVTVRDGFQHEEHYFSNEAKLYVIHSLIDAGCRHIETIILGNPRNTPQFRNAEELILALPKKEGVEMTIGLLNQKSVDRLKAMMDKGLVPDRVILAQLSTSEKHALHNVNRTHEQLFAEIEKMQRACEALSIKKTCVNVGTIFGCPIVGRMPLEKGYEFADRLFGMGVTEIEYSDHDGSATPDRVGEFFETILDKYPDPSRHIFHVHDSRGMGLACYYAAMCQGITHFECTLGGLGGQPANFMDGVPIRGTGEYYCHSRRQGLVVFEDFATMAEGMGVDTGIDLDKLYRAGRMVEKMVGRELGSFAGTAGPVELCTRD